MLSVDTRLRPNDEEVAAKVMDGEAILINLATGAYYSMDKIGGVIWETIERRSTLEEIAAAVEARYDVSAEQAREDVQRLVAELLEENLVKVTRDGAREGASLPRSLREKLPYEAPALSVYSDMRNLLALDPPPPVIDSLPWKNSGNGSSNGPQE